MAEMALRNVCKQFDSAHYGVKNFNLDIHDKEFVGLVAAVLCNKAFPGIRVFSTAYALPMAIASSSAAMIFQIMLHPTVGIVNKLLGLDINWLNDPRTALYCVAILTAWLNSGINFLYFSAGLGNIDETIYERASVDGASGVQQFFHLTLPGLSPIMFYTVVVNIIQEQLIKWVIRCL